MPLDIKVSARYERIYVHFNNVLHLHFDRAKFLGLQSWASEDTCQFHIEYTLQGGVIRSEYDTFEKWAEILRQMEQVLYWGAAHALPAADGSKT